MDKESNTLLEEVQKQRELLNKRFDLFSESRKGKLGVWNDFVHMELCTLYALHAKTLDILSGKKNQP